MDISRYSVDDFVFDETFQAYVAGPDSAAGRAWQERLRAHPEQQAAAAQARELLQALQAARPHALPPGLLARELHKLRQARQTTPAARPRLRVQRRAWQWAGALAAVLLVGLLGWWQWRRPAPAPGPRQQYATGPGQQRTLKLPDGSTVVLNHNSTLQLAASWPAGTPREVWLTGEGYFQVRHLAAAPDAAVDAAPAGAKFIVHAGAVRVAVLGTAFDVRSRGGSTRVVLSEGRVAVERPQLLGREKLLMQPGELVETSAARPGLTRRQVRPALYSGWTQGRLRFEQTSMREVVQLLRDSYGLRVEVADSALLRQTVYGEVPATSPDVLLAALSKTMNFRVVRKGNVVRFLAARR